MCACVCMHIVYMYVCMCDMCMHIWVCVCMHVCVQVCVCIYVCAYACMYVCGTRVSVEPAEPTVLSHLLQSHVASARVTQLWPGAKQAMENAPVRSGPDPGWTESMHNTKWLEARFSILWPSTISLF